MQDFTVNLLINEEVQTEHFSRLERAAMAINFVKNAQINSGEDDIEMVLLIDGNIEENDFTRLVEALTLLRYVDAIGADFQISKFAEFKREMEEGNKDDQRH